MTHAELFRRAVESEGWTVEYADEPQQRPDALGDFVDTKICQACKGNVLVVRPGCEGDAYYGAAHEIAEVRHGFAHRSVTWIEQSNILGRWCKDLARAAAARDSAKKAAVSESG